MSESSGIESLTFQTRDNGGKGVFSQIILRFIKMELKQVVDSLFYYFLSQRYC